MNKYLELGKIVNVKGLKGEVKIDSYAEDIFTFEKLKSLFVEKKENLTEYEIENVSYNKNQVIIKFKEVNSIEEAEKLRNSSILVDREIFGKLPEGVYYLADLIGLDVYTEENEYLGKVDDVYNTGSNDIYVIKSESGQERLLPGIDEVIKEINLDSGKIIVNLIKGL